jgi:thiol peroxidase
MKGSPMTLLGEEVKGGDTAPDFECIDINMNTVRLNDSAGKLRLISVVPSLDTSVCDLQTQRFEKEASEVSGDIVIYTISMDLPFAQKRYCGAHNISILKTLSDHRLASFGVNYGVLIKELRLLARSIFIIDRTDKVSYVEYVKEMGSHPDYDKALKALKSLSGGK